MRPYPDTNFFTRSYLDLPGSEIAESLFEQALQSGSGPMPITWLHRLEVANALERLVFESRKGGQHRVSPDSAAAAHAQFEEDLRAGLIVHEVAHPLRAVLDACRQLILRRTAKHGFRTYDCLHVASALALGCDTFWSFDKRILELAKLEGLKTN